MAAARRLGRAAALRRLQALAPPRDRTIAARCPALPLVVVCGATGSAKTRVLHALRARGAQVLDLEALACHKGSLLGALPGQPQPTQKAFETNLATALDALVPAQPVFVEAESRKIGKLSLPTPLIERMRAARCVEIQATSAGAARLSAARLRVPGRRRPGPGRAPRRAARASRPRSRRAVAGVGTRRAIARALRRAGNAALRPALCQVAGDALPSMEARRVLNADVLDDTGIEQIAQALASDGALGPG
jgi:tRNA 2-selenouridine synthase